MCTNYRGNKNINSIHIELIYSCNLFCSMCYNTEHPEVRNNKYAIQIYKDLLEHLKNLEIDEIGLDSSGEPFLFKKEAFDFIENSKCKTVSIITNATLLDDEDIERLKKSGKVKITVSLDSLNKEIFEKIRVGANFEKVYNNTIKIFEAGMLKQINFVKQPLNESEEKSFIEHFKSKQIKVFSMPIRIRNT